MTWSDEHVHELESTIKRLRTERDEARHGESVATATLQGVIEERTTLRAERDEARKMWCHAMWLVGGKRPNEQAKEKGWDCFGENTNG